MPGTLETPPVCSRSLPRHRKSVGLARDLLREYLDGAPEGEHLLSTGELILSELATNAVVHARVPPGRRIAVRFEVVCGHLRIEVHDASSERPAIRRSTGPDDSSGRGLCLVEALSTEWGCQPRPSGIGKIVWALAGPEGGVW
ncbi:ATP-binding protein [Streptomyces sp. SP17BM10]|uniref:ATP-binding protein n=1 Tax=Streptomyces sp. SP17BM10 TaxID=3002530 RepID=UPI002E77AF4E|nr:ATP-binding protein [Streptomyces sp. SP17BM10]MEE1787146.1 ATP-binding protein [Streptomyces sp. SP17BM10]